MALPEITPEELADRIAQRQGPINVRAQLAVRQAALDILQRSANEYFTARTLAVLDRLFNAQLTAAEGQALLFRKRKVDGGKGNDSKTVLVTDPETIRRYLDGELVDEDHNYYWIATTPPDARAANLLLDRALGKPKEALPAGQGASEGGDESKLIIEVVPLPKELEEAK